jgi:hypothetical protein
VIAAAGLIPRSPVRRVAPLVVRVPPIIKEYEAAVPKLTGTGLANADAGDGMVKRAKHIRRIVGGTTYFFSDATRA